MADDIRLISLFAPQGVQASPLSQGAGSNTPAVAINLPSGTIVSGFVINRDALGNPVLRTDIGDITFHADIFLKIGSEVVLRVFTQTGQQQARILSIDGQPPPVPGTQPPASATVEPDVIISQTLTPRAYETGIVKGLVLSTSSATPLPVNTQLSLKIISLQPTPSPPSSTAQTSQPPYVNPAQTDAPIPLSASQPPVVAAPPPDPRAELRTLATAVKSPPPETFPAVAPVITAPKPPPALAAGQMVIASVVGHEPTGETLVHMPFGIVRLQTSAPLPTGNKITLEIARISAPTTESTNPAPLTEIASHWTSLQQITTLLAARDGVNVAWNAPWMPSSLDNTSITPQHISTGLMIFITALKGGSFSNWLGEDNVQWLQTSGHDALVKKADAEFTSMARAFGDTPAQSTSPWQALIFPVAVAGAWQQVRLFLKRDRDQSRKDQSKEKEHTRFVIEMTLSRMGEMQIDGLVRREPKAVEFDLFIRSRSPLEADIQQEIQRIYQAYGKVTGYRGNLVFQAVRVFPVNPMEEIAQSTSGMLA